MLATFGVQWRSAGIESYGRGVDGALHALAGKDARQLALKLLGLTQAEFSTAFKASPLRRGKLRGPSATPLSRWAMSARRRISTSSHVRPTTRSRSCASTLRGSWGTD